MLGFGQRKGKVRNGEERRRPPAKTWERVAPPRRAVAARKEEGHEGEEGHGRLFFFSFV